MRHFKPMTEHGPSAAQGGAELLGAIALSACAIELIIFGTERVGEDGPTPHLVTCPKVHGKLAGSPDVHDLKPFP